MKKLVVLFMVVVFCLTGCSVEESVESEDSVLVVRLQEARDKLLAYPDYIISNTMELPYATLTSLSIRHDNVQYVEYPIDENGSVESRSFEEGGTYGLSEYRFEDGTWYYSLGDNLVRLPKSFASYRDDMRVLYIDMLLSNAKTISEGTPITMWTSYGEETFSTINMEVNSSVLKYIFGMPSYGLFASSATDTTNKDLEKYASWVVDDFESVYSYADDSRVVVMLDDQDRLRGVFIKGKGGGAVSYYTGVVVTFDNQNVRTAPNVENTQSFMATLMQSAALVADAETYEEALAILDSMESEASDNGGD